MSEIYRFYLRENDCQIETIATENIEVAENFHHIDLQSLVPNKRHVNLQVFKNQFDDLPTKISFIRCNTNFEQTLTETNFDASNVQQYSIFQDMVMTEGEAEQIVERVYDKIWQESEGYELQLG